MSPIRCGCHVYSKPGDYSRYKEPMTFKTDLPPLGCGRELVADELFRCLDCGMALCKPCLQSHCRHDLQDAKDELTRVTVERDRGAQFLRKAQAERDKLKAILDVRDGCVAWDTSCASCARAWDTSYADYMRAEDAEKATEALRVSYRLVSETLRDIGSGASAAMDYPGISPKVRDMCDIWQSRAAEALSGQVPCGLHKLCTASPPPVLVRYSIRELINTGWEIYDWEMKHQHSWYRDHAGALAACRLLNEEPT